MSSLARTLFMKAQHAVWMRDCFMSLLLCPDGSNKDSVFHLVMYTLESSTVEEVFGSGYRVFNGPQRVLTMLSRIYCL